MIFATTPNNDATPSKMICGGVLYDIDTAEELVTTRKPRQSYWSVIYKKKNGSLFLARLYIDDDTGKTRIINAVSDVVEIKEWAEMSLTYKEYISIFGEVSE
jgi:hypothetical protein